MKRWTMIKVTILISMKMKGE